MSESGWIVLAVVALVVLSALIFLAMARRAPVWSQKDEIRHDD